MITILPAIDLKDGKCVRLRQGKAEDKTIYSDDPVAVAKDWEAQGAEYLHVVDLDGAFQGKPVHTHIVKEIVNTLSIPVELGGGLREKAHIQEVLNCGIDRAIIGTRALLQPEELEQWATHFGKHLAVGIDAKDGKVQVSGWTDTSEIMALEFATEVDRRGIQTIIYTDISRDGMLQGVNVEAMRHMCDAISCSVIASGGVTSPKDIQQLMQLNKKNLRGAIVGKALYDGQTSLHELCNARI